MTKATTKVEKKAFPVRLSDSDKEMVAKLLEKAGLLLTGNRKAQKILEGMVKLVKSSTDWLTFSHRERSDMARILSRKGYLEETEKNPELVLDAMIKFVRDNK